MTQKLSGRRVTRSQFVTAGLFIIVVFVVLHSGRFQLQAALASFRNEPSALVIDSDRHDFGLVPRGQTLEARFRVTNVGGRRLVLHRENESCTCLSSDLDLLVPPGASKELRATLSTEQFQGAIQSHIRYRTNDPRRPSLDLTLVAEVAPFH